MVIALGGKMLYRNKASWIFMRCGARFWPISKTILTSVTPRTGRHPKPA